MDHMASSFERNENELGQGSRRRPDWRAKSTSRSPASAMITIGISSSPTWQQVEQPRGSSRLYIQRLP